MTGALKLGLMLGYWGAQPEDHLDLVLEAERLGFDSVWTAEAYGSDAISPLCWLGSRTTRITLATGLCQLSGRTPANMAMTAATIDHLCGGRFILGLGVSGPQVVEGWYGQPFPKPLARTREYVDILRAIWAREAPVVNDGEHYPLPYPGGAGLGKPLKITTHPLRARIPIYLGAEGPKNVALAAEIADGWLPIFYSPEHSAPMYADALAAAPADFDVACPVTVVLNDSVEEALSIVKWSLAFYIGGMGAKNMNFHLNVIGRMGFEEQAATVQELFLDNRREEAMQAVPDELADGIALVGPAARIKERLARWVHSPVTHLLAGTRDPKALAVLAEALA
jgi:F420-dependent oxidoreductase-like protein